MLIFENQSTRQKCLTSQPEILVYWFWWCFCFHGRVTVKTLSNESMWKYSFFIFLHVIHRILSHQTLVFDPNGPAFVLCISQLEFNTRTICYQDVCIIDIYHPCKMKPCLLLTWYTWYTLRKDVTDTVIPTGQSDI